jgi:aspartyl-tRNA(Asn)/glutamyl-tRNA(Gln) amidotransferase subunit A
MAPSDIFSPISEIGAKLRAKEFSCLELTRAFCDRFERLGPRYGALALSLREQAIRQARDVDDELKRGRTRGPLQGIPYGVKDLIAVKDHPTTWGARPFAGQVFREDARVIEKLNAARGVLIGKLSMISLAGGGNYRSPAASLTGPGRNPWDRDRWSGGSSSARAQQSARDHDLRIGDRTSGSSGHPARFAESPACAPRMGWSAGVGPWRLDVT